MLDSLIYASSDPEEEFLPVASLSEILYCERSFYLEITRGRKKERNIFVDRGLLEDENRLLRESNIANGHKINYGIRLVSEELGLVGYLDAIVETPSGLVPVEFKSTKFKESDTDDIALCAYALMLEESGYAPISEGRIVYTDSHRARIVKFDDSLRKKVKEIVKRANEILTSVNAPPPVNDARCKGCSFASWCLPTHVSGELGAGVLPSIGLERVLYVDRPFAYVKLKGGTLEITEDKQLISSVPLESIDRVVIVGRSEISASAIRALLRQGIDIFFISRSGKLEGSVAPILSLNGILREAQHKFACDPLFSLAIAKRFVQTKIHNQRVVLQRYANEAPDVEFVQKELEKLSSRITDIADFEQLRGIEGACGKLYFRTLSWAFEKRGLDMPRRSRRPPKDPANALLSFAYGLLKTEVISGVLMAGLDPYIGFYHSSKYGRPALVLDLMEEFRPAIADSAVLAALGRQMIKLDDFENKFGYFILTESGRKSFYSAWELRIREEITHPYTELKLSWRRAIEAQARLLAKCLINGEPSYVGVKLRW